MTPAEVDVLRGEIQSLSQRLEIRFALASAEASVQAATTKTEILKLMIWVAIIGQAGLVLAVGAFLQRL